MQPLDHLKVAGEAEALDLLRMTKLYHSSSVFRALPYDEEKVTDVIADLLSRKQTDAIVLVSMDGEKAVGMIGGVATEQMFNRERFSTEVLWWVDPEYRKGTRGKHLKEAYTYWAKNVSACRHAVMACMADEKEAVLTRVFTRSGFDKMETMFIKEL